MLNKCLKYIIFTPFHCCIIQFGHSLSVFVNYDSQQYRSVLFFFFFYISSYRAKVFRGKKVHGEFDIKVEQVGSFFNSSYRSSTTQQCACVINQMLPKHINWLKIIVINLRGNCITGPLSFLQWHLFVFLKWDRKIYQNCPQ